MTAASALSELREWPAEERLDLLFGLWDQLVEDGWKPTLSEDLKLEIDRRWSNYRANPESAMSFEQIVADVKSGT